MDHRRRIRSTGFRLRHQGNAVRAVGLLDARPRGNECLDGIELPHHRGGKDRRPSAGAIMDFAKRLEVAQSKVLDANEQLEERVIERTLTLAAGQIASLERALRSATTRGWPGWPMPSAASERICSGRTILVLAHHQTQTTTTM